MSIALTFEELENTLEEKGYLADNFMKANAVRYWLDGIKEEYEMRFNNAVVSNAVDSFSKESVGSFDSGIDRVKFRFYFDVDPNSETISFFHLQTQLDKAKKNYIIKNLNSLPNAIDAYKKVKRHALDLRIYKRTVKLKKEFKWQRDPENDFKPEKPRSNRQIRLVMPQQPDKELPSPSKSSIRALLHHIVTRRDFGPRP